MIARKPGRKKTEQEKIIGEKLLSTSRRMGKPVYF
jgi:hypothetical protein